MSSIDIPNACQTSANEPVGTTSLEAAACNLSFTDRFANSGDLTVTSRVGLSQDSIAGIQAKANAALNDLGDSFGFIIQGDFATGFTIEARNQVGQATDGTIWRYTGSLPFTVPAGTVPAAPTYSQLVETDHNELTNRNAVSAHNSSSIEYDNVSLEQHLDNPVIQGEAAPAYNIITTDSTGESTDRRIISIIDDVLYADSSTTLYESNDMGATWSAVFTKPGRWTKMLKCDDGEILVINGGPLVEKSSGWSVNRATATFRVVLTFPNLTGVLRWGIDGDGTKFIATHYENGGTRADVRYAYISLDDGDNWGLVWDSVARFGPVIADQSHLHAACYDKYNDRFWLCEGHSDLGVFYSDNDGVAWTRLDATGFYEQSTPTTLTATPYGIVAGTDQFPNGTHLFKGDDASTLRVEVAYVYRSLGAGTQLQCDAAVTDPKTGMVYIAASGHSAPAKSVIMASNGETASLVYESDTLDAIFNLAVKDGIVIAHQAGTPYRVIRGRVSTIGSKQPLYDAGNSTPNDIAPNLSTVVGKGSTADSLNSVALGREVALGTVGGQDCIGVGHSIIIESGTDNYAVGRNINLTGTTANVTVVTNGLTLNNITNAVVFGTGASTTSSNTVAFGSGANVLASNGTAAGNNASVTAGNGTAIGNQSTAGLLGTSVGSMSSANTTNATAVGYNSNTTGANGTTLGANASTTHSGAVALGASTATQRVNSVCVGDRDIESTKNAAGLLLKSPDGTLYKLTPPNGGGAATWVLA